MAFAANQQVRELARQLGDNRRPAEGELLDRELTEITEFLQREQRRPKEFKNKAIDEEKDEVEREAMKAERRLSKRIGTIQKNYAKRQFNMKDETSRAKWEEFMNSELGQLLIVLDSDELFNLNLTATKEFMQREQRRPKIITNKAIEEEKDEVQRDAMKEEKRLATWIGAIQKNYAKRQFKTDFFQKSTFFS